MNAAIPVIVNAGAGIGCGNDIMDKIRDTFRAAGASARILPAHNGMELQQIAATAARECPPVIVAGGGDGTISAVASALTGTQTALGILPLGTLNHFAKDLRIPPDLEHAVSVVVGGRRIDVDVGVVNGRIFLNNSSIGLYPDMVRRRSKQQEQLGRGKWHAMFWATLTVLRRSPFLNVHLGLDGVQHDCRTPFIFIGNNNYQMEGFKIGQRPRLDGACLSVYYTQRRGRWGLLSLALRALFGRLYQTRDFTAGTAQTLTIRTRHKRLLVATDGEIAAMDVPLEYKSQPGALRVMAPLPVAGQG